MISKGKAPEAAGIATFTAIISLAEDGQNAKVLPSIPTLALATLISAMTHGLIDLKIAGCKSKQGLFSVAEQGISLFLPLLKQSAGTNLSEEPSAGADGLRAS